jgi:anti-anti-sigma factor
VAEPEPFAVAVRRHQQALVVTPSGELDLATVDDLDAVIADAIDDAQHLVLDLSELEFIDTSGLRCILSQQAESERRGRRFTLVAGSPEIQRLFDVAGVADRLPFVATVDAALSP